MGIDSMAIEPSEFGIDNLNNICLAFLLLRETPLSLLYSWVASCSSAMDLLNFQTVFDPFTDNYHVGKTYGYIANHIFIILSL